MEGLRQKFSCGSAFQPTSNPRCFQMYRELQNHSKLIAGLQKQVKRLETSTEGMLTLVETAYTTELPRDYAIVEQTAIGAKSCATDAPLAISDAEREQKRNQVGQLRATLHDRMEAEVYAPSSAWIAEVKAASVDLKSLEKMRLTLDAQRRKTAKAEMKKVKQNLNKGVNSTSFVERHNVATQQLDEHKAQFDAHEETVYQKLRDLVGRSNVVFDTMEKAFAIGNDVMNHAQALAPTNNAMGMAPPGTYTVVANEKTPFSSPDKVDTQVQEAVAEQPAVPEEAVPPVPSKVSSKASKKGSKNKVVEEPIPA